MRRAVENYLKPVALIHRAGAGRGFSRLSPDRQSFQQIARDLTDLLGFQVRRIASRFLFDVPFHGGQYGDQSA